MITVFLYKLTHGILVVVVKRSMFADKLLILPNREDAISSVLVAAEGRAGFLQAFKRLEATAIRCPK